LAARKASVGRGFAGGGGFGFLFWCTGGLTDGAGRMAAGSDIRILSCWPRAEGADRGPRDRRPSSATPRWLHVGHIRPGGSATKRAYPVFRAVRRRELRRRERSWDDAARGAPDRQPARNCPAAPCAPPRAPPPRALWPVEGVLRGEITRKCASRPTAPEKAKRHRLHLEPQRPRTGPGGPARHSRPSLGSRKRKRAFGGTDSSDGPWLDAWGPSRWTELHRLQARAQAFSVERCDLASTTLTRGARRTGLLVFRLPESASPRSFVRERFLTRLGGRSSFMAALLPARSMDVSLLKREAAAAAVFVKRYLTG